MNEPLYFIPCLIEALEGSDIKTSLKSAFREITQKGAQSQYAAGFQNFAHFMDEACLRHNTIETNITRELIVLLATGAFDGIPEENRTALNRISSCSQWKAEQQAFFREAGECPGQLLTPAIQILRGEQLIREVMMRREGEYIDGIVAGQYTVKLDIGMVIWEGELTAKDLLWAEAFTARDLDLAAETPGMEQQSTREMVLLDGALIIRVFAGIESGFIEVGLNI